MARKFKQKKMHEKEKSALQKTLQKDPCKYRLKPTHKEKSTKI